MLIGVVVALVVVAVAGGAVAIGRRPQPISVDGLPVTNAAEVLAQLERQVRDRVVKNHGRTTDELRCWLSYTGSASPSPNQLIRCGPVLFVGDDPGSPWLTYGATLNRDVDEAGQPSGFHFVVDPVGRPSRLADDEVLRRPDGAEPPERVTVDPPDRPGISADFTAVLPVEPAVALLSLHEDARLTGTRYVLRIRRSATLDRLPTRSGTIVAPAGTTLVVAEVAFAAATSDTPTIYSTKPPLAVWLDVDGVRRPQLPLTLRTGNRDPQMVVAAVPSQARSIRLTVEEEGSPQAIELPDGKRTGSAPKIYYRSTTRSTVALSAWRLSLPYDATGVLGPSHRVADLTIREAMLDWTYQYTTHPSSPDRAFLMISVQTSMLGDVAGALMMPLDRVRLRLPDGSTVTPTSSDGRADLGFDRSIAWEVPWDFQQGTILVTPGVFDTHYSAPGGPDGTVTYDYHDATAEIPISIPLG